MSSTPCLKLWYEKLWYEIMIWKRATASEKSISGIMQSQFPNISINNFSHNNTFFQPNVNGINSLNENLKNQQESVANQISNKPKNTNHNLDIEELINLRKLYTNNPIIGYLNIHSPRNKITWLREVCGKAPIDLLCIDETKLNASFPDAQFHIEGYQYLPFRQDHDRNGGGGKWFLLGKV